jgi:hypothetical protein
LRYEGKDRGCRRAHKRYAARIRNLCRSGDSRDLSTRAGSDPDRGFRRSYNTWRRAPPTRGVYFVERLSKPAAAERQRNGDTHRPDETTTETTPMQYLFLLYANEGGWSQLTAAQQEQGKAAYMAYTQTLRKEGVLVGSNRLQPIASATTVHVADGKSQVLDGPYADTKEQLGGYYLVDVPDLDAALAWAARCPGASHGTIEVRPVWPTM